jgi:hypothetical protein
LDMLFNLVKIDGGTNPIVASFFTASAVDFLFHCCLFLFVLGAGIEPAPFSATNYTNRVTITKHRVSCGTAMPVYGS